MLRQKKIYWEKTLAKTLKTTKINKTEDLNTLTLKTQHITLFDHFFAFVLQLKNILQCRKIINYKNKVSIETTQN